MSATKLLAKKLPDMTAVQLDREAEILACLAGCELNLAKRSSLETRLAMVRRQLDKYPPDRTGMGIPRDY